MAVRILRRLDDISLRGKIISSIAIFLMLPSFIVSFSVASQIRTIMVHNAFDLSDENVVRAANRTGDAMESALSISDRLAIDTQLEQLVNQHYATTLDVFTRYRDYTRLRDFLITSPMIARIKIYATNETLINNWSFIPVDDATRSLDWYRAAVDAGGENLWLTFADVTKDERSTLSLVRLIPFSRYGSSGVLVIDLDVARLSEMLAQESFDTFLVDDAGTIVAAGDRAKRGVSYASIAPQMPALDDTDGTSPVTIGGDRYRMLYRRLDLRNSVNGITVVSLVSMDTITAQTSIVWRIALTVMIVIFALGLFFLAVVFSVFVRRLVAISRGMDVVAGGHFHGFLPIEGSDEIAQLAQRFNNMVANIQGLMDEIHQSNEERRIVEQHQAEIKLKMLASQINPHFLFNSLEAVRMKAHLEHQREIADVVKQLGKLMRRVLEVNGGRGPLANELEIVQTYLRIERFRLDTRLEYEISIPPEALTVPIPPLLLQPLVENAVVHGIERRRGNGRLSIAGTIEDARLTLVVEDDGPGMNQAALEELQCSLAALRPAEQVDRVRDASAIDRGGLDRGALDRRPDTAGDRRSHIGMRNVQERLILTFGAESALDVSSLPGRGMRVAFTIPVA